MDPVDKAYADQHGIEDAVKAAVEQVLKEKPENPLGRIAQILSPAPVAVENYWETVGNTPLVRLKKMLPEGCKAIVYGKMEMQNPGGSIKDRIALHMMEKAEQSGKLKPGMTVVEFTSGNTGIGLGMCASAKGYKSIIVMPRVPPMFERYLICRQYGCEVHLTAAAQGIKGMMKHFNDLMATDPEGTKYWSPAQFKNFDNPETHELTTGPEIWAQTGGKVDVFIHGVGTGGCVAGTSKFLKGKKPEVRVVAVEPTESRANVGGPDFAPKPHTLVGIGAGVPVNFFGLEHDEASNLSKALGEDKPIPGLIDEWGHCTSAQGIEYCKKACVEEGMMVGPTSGAALKVAVEIAMRPEMEGKTIVAIIPSNAIRYTQHPFWAELKKEAAAALPAPPDMAKDLPALQWKSSDYTPA